jgi:aspartate/tyrosine/aromatic aminotransferase
MSFFEQVTPATPDAIFGLSRAFAEDPRKEKVNLTVGLYKTEELITPILPSVKKAEEEILRSEKSKEYLPLEGHKVYLEEIGKLLFGELIWTESSARIAKVQAVGGTHALRSGGEFLVQEKIADTIHVSDPTWPNHRAIFARAGMRIENYPYYGHEKHDLSFEKMRAYLSKLPSRSVVLLHACCHNPTGADLSLDQWKELSQLFLSKKLIPFFDLAYQGFDRGLAEDAEAIRLFAREGHEMVVAYSLSKNFGLYAERVGALFVVCETHKSRENVGSKLVATTRPNISNPPLHGAQIVATILTNSKLKKEWEMELTAMRERINGMRNKLAEALSSKTKKVDFSFLKERAGLFSFSGLNSAQVERLIRDYGIYMTKDGRINAVGLNSANLDYVVNSILSVV